MRTSNRMVAGAMLAATCLVGGACTATAPASSGSGVATGSAVPSDVPGGPTGGTPVTSGAEIPENVLTYAYAKEWPQLDPSVAFSAEPDVLAQVYETLTVFNPETGEVEPGLATSWENDADGTEWTFQLQEGVKFHDGSDFDAEAVKFTVERAKEINRGPAYIFDAVESIDTPDPLTVTFNLSAARPMDLIMAAGWGAFILSPSSDDQPSEWFQEGQGIGTGPYMWESYQPGESAVLARFPGYWGGWRPGQFTQVIYTFTPEATSRQQELLSGSAQLTLNLNLEDLRRLEADPNVTIAPLNIIGIRYLLFNNARPPLDDVDVRQALAHSFPTEDVVDNLFGEYATINKNSLVPDGVWGHTTDLPGYDYDLDRARELLEQAGVSELSLEFAYTGSFPEEVLIGQLWKATLEQLGVTLNLRQYTFNALIATSDNPSTAPHAQFEYWPPTYPSPYDYLFSVFGTGQGGNVAFYSNPEVDELIDRGLTESGSDRDAAVATFTEAQRLILEDAPGIPVFDQPEVFVGDSAIDGYLSRGFTIYLYGLTES